MTTIGKRILQRRQEIGMSQDELAKIVGYKDRSSIARIESGERDVRQKMIVVFAKALKTTPSWLMGYDEKTAPAASGESDQLKSLFDSPKTRSEWLDILSGLTRENKIKLLEYARLLLLSQAQADQEDPK